MDLNLVLRTSALLIAAAGLTRLLSRAAPATRHGIVAYSVSQRVREFGIRIALGGRPTRIVGMVVWQNLRVVLLGVGVGLAGAIPATRLLRGLLFDVEPNDPGTFAIIGTTLVVVAMIASYVPARRGTGVDPAVTLRAE